MNNAISSIGGAIGNMVSSVDNENSANDDSKAEPDSPDKSGTAATPPDPEDDKGKKGKKSENDLSKSAKRMSKGELDKAAKNNGYKNIHEMKREYQLGKETDIFADKYGNLYAGSTKGRIGAMENLSINKFGN